MKVGLDKLKEILKATNELDVMVLNAQAKEIEIKQRIAEQLFALNVSVKTNTICLECGLVRNNKIEKCEECKL